MIQVCPRTHQWQRLDGAKAFADRPPQLPGRCGGRHQHERIGGQRRLERADDVDERGSIAGKIRGAAERNATGRDHLLDGGSIAVN